MVIIFSLGRGGGVGNIGVDGRGDGGGVEGKGGDGIRGRGGDDEGGGGCGDCDSTMVT